MIYYALHSARPLQRCVTDYPELPVSFLDGKPIDTTAIPAPLALRGNFDAAAPPSHFETGMIPVFSDQLVAYLRSAGIDNLQTVQCTIEGDDGTFWAGYQAVQVIGLVACCDLDETEHDVIMQGDDDQIPTLISADRVVIDPSRVPADLQLFRLAEDPSHLIAPESLVDAIIENKPEGGWGIAFKAASLE